MALHFDLPEILTTPPPPLAITWLKAQGIGMAVLVGLKIFPICNPYLGFDIGVATYLIAQTARYFFRQLLGEKHPLLEYGYALMFSTFCLHNFVHLALPAMDHLLQFDLNYMFLRTAITVTYIVGEALFQKYKPQTT